MPKVPNSLKHGSTSYLFAISKGLQKAAYYGFRAILVLFLIDQMQLERDHALSWYGTFTGMYLSLQLVASLISDLIQQNRKVMLWGGVIQIIGFVLIGLFDQSWIVGMSLVALGGAMFEDNHSSFFGKLYKDKKPLLDAGFTILIVMVNIGAMLGILVLGLIGEESGYQLSFIIAAAIMGCAVYIMYRYEDSNEFDSIDPKPNMIDDKVLDSEYFSSDRLRSKSGLAWIFGLILAILIVFFTVPLSEDVFAMQVSNKDHSASFLSSVGAYMSMVFGVILAIVWSYNYSSQYAKMIIGVLIFLFFYILLKNSYFLLGGNDGIVLFLGFTVLFELSYIFIAPVVYSLITEHANPRYYATFYACSRIPEKLLYLFGLGSTMLVGLNQYIGIAILVVLGICALLLHMTRKKPII